MKKMEAFKESVKQCKPEYLAVTLLLIVTILAGLAYLAFVPKQTFSEEENRALEEIPQLSLENLADGSFMSSAESYVGDHFMLRQAFISLSTTVKLGLGFRDAGGNYSSVPAEGGVYFGGNGHLYEVLLPNKDQVFAQNVKGLAAFCEGAGLPFYVVPVPSGAQEQAQNLPLFSYSHNQREEFEALRAAIGENGAVVDLFDALNLWNGDYYYKTDHHWTSRGAYQAYCAYMRAVGGQPSPEDAYEKVAREGFYGTTYAQSGYFASSSDTMEMWVSDWNASAFHWEKLDGYDMYQVFLGGDVGVDVLDSPSAPEGTLLLFKDSFADALAPFLMQHYSRIVLIDLRYARNTDLAKLVAEYAPQEILFVYCGDSLVNETSLRLLDAAYAG